MRSHKSRPRWSAQTHSRYFGGLPPSLQGLIEINSTIHDFGVVAVSVVQYKLL